MKHINITKKKLKLVFCGAHKNFLCQTITTGNEKISQCQYFF